MVFSQMAFTTSTNRSLMIATGLFVGLLSTNSYAYTAEQQQLCTGDAMRLCSAEIPDEGRVTACMIRQQASLSEGCKSVFRMEPAASERPQPASYKPSAAKASKPINLTPQFKRG